MTRLAGQVEGLGQGERPLRGLFQEGWVTSASGRWACMEVWHLRLLPVPHADSHADAHAGSVNPQSRPSTKHGSCCSLWG